MRNSVLAASLVLISTVAGAAQDSAFGSLYPTALPDMRTTSAPLYQMQQQVIMPMQQQMPITQHMPMQQQIQLQQQLPMPQQQPSGYLTPEQTPTVTFLVDTPQGAVPAGSAAAPAMSSESGPGQGDNGTNPAQNNTTFIVSNEYYTLDGGNRINTTYTRFKYPFMDQRGSVLFEIPFVYYNFEATSPDLPQVGGLGDVKIQMNYNLWSSHDKRITVVSMMEMFLPTADNALVNTVGDTGNQLTAFNLGTGKFVAGPGGALVFAITPNFIIAPVYFFEASIFGNSERSTIRRGKFRLFSMYAWDNGMYVLPEFQILSNMLTGNNDIYLAPEVGYSCKGMTMYVKPGFGIDPDQNDREWGIEFGFRFMY